MSTKEIAPNVLQVCFSPSKNPQINIPRAIIPHYCSNPKRITFEKEKKANIRAPNGCRGSERGLKCKTLITDFYGFTGIFP